MYPIRSIVIGKKRGTLRADHTVDGLKIEFRPRPVWEPYVEAVLARQRQGLDTLTPVTTSERKTGLEPATLTLAR